MSAGRDRPLVSVCMVAHGAHDWVARTLDALTAHTDPAHCELVVIDSASPDDTASLLREYAPTSPIPMRVHYSEHNLGFAAGNNLAANLARGSMLCLLNTDALVPAGWLDPMVAPLVADDAIGATVPLFVGLDGRLQEAGTNVEADGRVEAFGIRADPDDVEWSWPRRIATGSAACWMTRTATFRALGGFDAGYGLAYYEDVDLAFEMARRGLRLELVPSVRVVHAQGASSPSNAAAEVRRDANQARFVARQAAMLTHRWHTRDLPNEPHRSMAARDVDVPTRVLVIVDEIPALGDRRVPTPSADTRVTIASANDARPAAAQSWRALGVEVVGDPVSTARARLFQYDEVVAPAVWLDAHTELLADAQPQASLTVAV